MVRIGIDCQPECIVLSHIKFNRNCFGRDILLIQRSFYGFGYLITVDISCIGIDRFFYPDVADIARFDATQGTDRYGVILTWEQTPGGLDFYELSRREAGSTAEFEPVKTTEETNYRDDDAVPGKEYEYRLMASFSCNDTTTTSFATTTGFRSPYGLISGRIHYSDGTGCPDTNSYLLLLLSISLFCLVFLKTYK